MRLSATTLIAAAALTLATVPAAHAGGFGTFLTPTLTFPPATSQVSRDAVHAETPVARPAPKKVPARN